MEYESHEIRSMANNPDPQTEFEFLMETNETVYHKEVTRLLLKMKATERLIHELEDKKNRKFVPKAIDIYGRECEIHDYGVEVRLNAEKVLQKKRGEYVELIQKAQSSYYARVHGILKRCHMDMEPVDVYHTYRKD